MRVNQRIIDKQSAELARRDSGLRRILASYGPPPLWPREPGFATLLRIILEQQVSLASAQATFTKLDQAIGDVSPKNFMQLKDEELRTLGFSRQKTRYGRALSEAVLHGELDLEAINKLENDQAKQALMAVKGIGHWTADIYLMMALKRPDIWPHGDLALAVAYQEVHNLEHRPDYDSLHQLAERWSPWRAVAARMLWHFYLRRRQRSFEF